MRRKASLLFPRPMAEPRSGSRDLPVSSRQGPLRTAFYPALRRSSLSLPYEAYEASHCRKFAMVLTRWFGAAEQHRWHFEADRFRSLEIDTQLEFGRLVKRDISRISTSKNLLDEVGDAAKDVRQVGRISHQPASFDKIADRINCGDPAFRRPFDNRRTIGAVLGFIRYHEPIRSILFHRSEDALVLCLVKSAQHSRRQRNPSLFGRLLRCRTSWIFPESSRCKVTNGGQFWHRLDQQPHTFSNDFQSSSDSNACNVAARPRDACHKSL